MTLMEATGKKLAFCRHVALSVAEFMGSSSMHNRRDRRTGLQSAGRNYDLVLLARAVARLPILLEYLLPAGEVGVERCRDGRDRAREVPRPIDAALNGRRSAA
jgi:16S rRNA G527 N7-methylase RsmG